MVFNYMSAPSIGIHPTTHHFTTPHYTSLHLTTPRSTSFHLVSPSQTDAELDKGLHVYHLLSGSRDGTLRHWRLTSRPILNANAVLGGLIANAGPAAGGLRGPGSGGGGLGHTWDSACLRVFHNMPDPQPKGDTNPRIYVGFHPHPHRLTSPIYRTSLPHPLLANQLNASSLFSGGPGNDLTKPVALFSCSYLGLVEPVPVGEGGDRVARFAAGDSLGRLRVWQTTLYDTGVHDPSAAKDVSTGMSANRTNLEGPEAAGAAGSAANDDLAGAASEVRTLTTFPGGQRVQNLTVVRGPLLLASLATPVVSTR